LLKIEPASTFPIYHGARPLEQVEGEQMIRRSLVLIAAGVFAGGASWKIWAQSTVPVFTAAQSDGGRAAYAQNCASCHGDNLDDGQFGPALRGNEFRLRWSQKTLDELFSYLSTKMPPDRTGALENKTYTTLLAYLLEANGVQPGTRELSSESDQLRALTIPRQVPSTQQRLRVSGLGVSLDAVLPAWPAVPNPLDKITPVTDAMLSNPAAGEWLMWRRTYDDLGFSPLKQITKDNVKNLRVAWTLTLPPGPNEATPLVHDGVIFVHSYNDNVQALDAVTGNELWHYSRRLPEGTRASTKRNMALYGTKLYFGTSDLHVVALDTKTGDVVWDSVVAKAGERWNLTGGPLAAKGKVMQGIGGQGRGGAYITALDSETGKETWRFYTVARPDESDGNTWNGLALDDRTGGSVWTAGSYDPDLNLAFFGPAPSYDTGPLRNPVNRPGTTNDALYTDTTIAINPDTGNLVWHYQHVPNDQWDLDWAFERQIIRLPGNGNPSRKLVITAGKPGIYDAVEAGTGKYAFSFDMGLQNIIKSINPETGAKAIDEKLIPGTGQPVVICPHAVGGRNWIPGAYNPDTKILYVPAVETCMNMSPVEAGTRGFLSTGVRISVIARPESDGRYGRIQAINVDTRKTVWTERQRAPQTTGVLATAGGVVFAGALDRWFTAYSEVMAKHCGRSA
jgi:PQQ-dependent dehydrogenase (methanol/ethanol family)